MEHYRVKPVNPAAILMGHHKSRSESRHVPVAGEAHANKMRRGGHHRHHHRYAEGGYVEHHPRDLRDESQMENEERLRPVARRHGRTELEREDRSRGNPFLAKGGHHRRHRHHEEKKEHHGHHEYHAKKRHHEEHREHHEEPKRHHRKERAELPLLERDTEFRRGGHHSMRHRHHSGARRFAMGGAGKERKEYPYT